MDKYEMLQYPKKRLGGQVVIEEIEDTGRAHSLQLNQPSTSQANGVTLKRIENNNETEGNYDLSLILTKPITKMDLKVDGSWLNRRRNTGLENSENVEIENIQDVIGILPTRFGNNYDK